MILLVYIENLIIVTISSTEYHNDNLILSHTYSGTRSAIPICMKTIYVQTKKISDKTIKALELVGYKVIIIIK